VRYNQLAMPCTTARNYNSANVTIETLSRFVVRPTSGNPEGSDKTTIVLLTRQTSAFQRSSRTVCRAWRHEKQRELEIEREATQLGDV
jgi:hypothetical protein